MTSINNHWSTAREI